MFCDKLRDHCGSSLLPQRSSKGALIVPVDTHTSRGAVFATEVSIQSHHALHPCSWVSAFLGLFLDLPFIVGSTFWLYPIVGNLSLKVDWFLKYLLSSGRFLKNIYCQVVLWFGCVPKHGFYCGSGCLVKSPFCCPEGSCFCFYFTLFCGGWQVPLEVHTGYRHTLSGSLLHCSSQRVIHCHCPRAQIIQTLLTMKYFNVCTSLYSHMLGCFPVGLLV